MKVQSSKVIRSWLEHHSRNNILHDLFCTFQKTQSLGNFQINCKQISLKVGHKNSELTKHILQDYKERQKKTLKTTEYFFVFWMIFLSFLYLLRWKTSVKRIQHQSLTESFSDPNVSNWSSVDTLGRLFDLYSSFFSLFFTLF